MPASDPELVYQVFQQQRGYYMQGLTLGMFEQLYWPAMRGFYEASDKSIRANPFPDKVGAEAKLGQLYAHQVEHLLSVLGGDLSNLENFESRGDKMGNGKFLENCVELACEKLIAGMTPAEILAAVGVEDPARWQAASKSSMIEAFNKSDWVTFNNRYRDTFTNSKFQSHFAKIFSTSLAPPKVANRISSRIGSKAGSSRVASKSINTVAPVPNVAFTDARKPASYTYEELLGTALPPTFTYEQLLGSVIEQETLSADAQNVSNRLTDKVRKERDALREKYARHKERREARKAEKKRREEEGMAEGRVAMLLECHHDSESDSDSDSSHLDDMFARGLSSRTPSPTLEASSGDMDSPLGSREQSPEFEEPVGNSFSFQPPMAQFASASPSPVPSSVTRPGLVKREQLAKSVATPASPVPQRPGLRPAVENPAAVQKLLQSPTFAHMYLKTFLKEHGAQFRNQNLVYMAPSNQVLQAKHAQFLSAPMAQVALAAGHLFKDPAPDRPLQARTLAGVTADNKQVQLDHAGQILRSDGKQPTTAIPTYRDNMYGIQVRILMQDCLI